MAMNNDRISVSAPSLGGNVAKYVLDCLETTWISSNGRYIGLFEQRFADFCGVKHAIACNNGTTALHLALVGLGIGPGDEVIVPDLTYIASANCVRYCGATPVFADNDPVTFNVDPAAVRAAITPRTKAIMPVHLYGHPCEMGPLCEIAHAHGLLVVEDAAEAHGAIYDGRKVGGFGDCASFSFYGNKIITTGEGGMITTDNDELAARMRMLRNQGMDPGRRYWFPAVGYNYRMTNIAAAIGLAQMERVDELLADRQEIRKLYDHGLAEVPHLALPAVVEPATHVFWMYTVRLLDSAPLSRDELIKRLDGRGVETRPAFYPMHLMPPYSQNGDAFPNATLCGRQGINLPTHSQLTAGDVARVCENLRDLLASKP